MKGVMFNGSPTGADVRTLLDAFGAPTVGWEVTHEAVADVLGVEIGGHRYLNGRPRLGQIEEQQPFDLRQNLFVAATGAADGAGGAGRHAGAAALAKGVVHL